MKVNHIYQGDALEVLQSLEAQQVDMCVTSPPYWGLRDYGVEGQLGLEQDFNEYIDKLCTIFDEVKRVLKDEGTCWVNIGDSYNGSGKAGSNPEYQKKHTSFGKIMTEKSKFGKPINDKRIGKKSLIGIPFRFAIEMINRGWILRNTIIWHKPNCMPSSVKDRFTVDFEYLFFFSKNKKYYFEQQFEPIKTESLKRSMRKSLKNWKKNMMPPIGGCKHKANGNPIYSGNEVPIPIKGRNKRCVWNISTKPYKGAHFAVFPEELIETPIKAGCPANGVVLDPFMGSGTTAAVAKRLNRNYVGIELNPEYHGLIHGRLDKTARIKPLN